MIAKSDGTVIESPDTYVGWVKKSDEWAGWFWEVKRNGQEFSGSTGAAVTRRGAIRAARRSVNRSRARSASGASEWERIPASELRVIA